jgi:sensor histidine kinase YesM
MQQLEAEVPDCSVLALLLQPLVENAIRHGIEPSADVGWVWIRAERMGEGLVLSLKDDGAGLPVAEAAHLKEGVGLSSARERLQTLYPRQHELRIEPRPGGGVAVRIRLPFQPAAEKVVAAIVPAEA